MDYPIEISRKHIRTLRLSIKRDGRVCLSVPLLCTNARIQAFLSEHEEWIKQTRERVLVYQEQHTHHYTTGEIHSLLGQEYPLRVIETTSKPHAELADGEILIYVKPGSDDKQRMWLLYQLYKQELMPVFESLLHKWEDLLNRHGSQITMRLMKTEWGSCTPMRKHMTFNIDLARVPVSCIEYVIVHELTHYDHPNHSHAFWQLVDDRLMQYGINVAEGNQQHAITLRKQLRKYPL